MSISVIMPVYLGNYEDGATNRSEKFRRAIDSFLNQTDLENVELIIVGDGCDTSSEIFNNEYRVKYGHLIKYYSIAKQLHFSGKVRSHGISKSNHEFITYLDSDDIFEPTHIENMRKVLLNLPKSFHWIYYNVNILLNGAVHLQVVDKKKGACGTCSITHRRMVDGKEINWDGCDGYGHDWTMIDKYLLQHRSKKVQNMGYIICHQPKFIDN